MNLLATILVILSVSKLYAVCSTTRGDIEEINTLLPNVHKGLIISVIGFIMMESLAELLCGMFILFT